MSYPEKNEHKMPLKWQPLPLLSLSRFFWITSEQPLLCILNTSLVLTEIFDILKFDFLADWFRLFLLLALLSLSKLLCDHFRTVPDLYSK